MLIVYLDVWLIWSNHPSCQVEERCFLIVLADGNPIHYKRFQLIKFSSVFIKTENLWNSL
eukprot:jgi/Orpsp1_1/1176923/evm.model.c7180000059505.2